MNHPNVRLAFFCIIFICSILSYDTLEFSKEEEYDKKYKWIANNFVNLCLRIACIGVGVFCYNEAYLILYND